MLLHLYLLREYLTLFAQVIRFCLLVFISVFKQQILVGQLSAFLQLENCLYDVLVFLVQMVVVHERLLVSMGLRFRGLVSFLVSDVALIL